MVEAMARFFGLPEFLLRNNAIVNKNTIPLKKIHVHYIYHNVFSINA